MTRSLVQPRSIEIGLDETSWLSKLMARLVRRSRMPSTDRLSDHLMRDAGLERVGGVTRQRMR
ncbi:MAG TPA: hypothetical protein VJ790_19760 [Dongiaceae bacterium]|nr:hypothetical protein [Dongiaceae bacterium]